MNRVLAAIEAGKRDARLVCGGKRVTRDGSAAAISSSRRSSPDAGRECARHRRDLRPVMSVLKFSSEDEVVRAPTRHRSGSPPACSRAISRARIASSPRCRPGVCWINNYNITPIEIPFGGMKQSGIGRENGLAAIEHYTQLKSVYVEMGDVACPY
jgi:betaine-aldehyde dehydrogenase